MFQTIRKYWYLFIGLMLLLLLPWKGVPKAVFYDIDLHTAAVLPSSASYTVGSFSIVWNTHRQQLSVYHSAQPDKILWASVPGKGFCGAAKGAADIKEHSGSFTINDSKTAITHLQQINSITKKGASVVVEGTMQSEHASVAYQLVFSPQSANRLHLQLSVKDTSYNRLLLTYQCDTSEQFFGMGEQPTHFNHKGNRVPVLVQEQGIGRGDAYSDNPVSNFLVGAALGASRGDAYTTYKATPHYISSLSNSLYLENYEYSVFDFTQKDKVQIEVHSGRLEANIIYAPNPIAAIEEYTLYSGRMRALPDWILKGAVIGMQGGTQKAYDVWRTLHAAGTPIAAFWLQDWIGQRTTMLGKQLWWNWELDKNQYKNWDMLVDSLRNNGISVMGYINPFIVEVEGNREGYRRNQYKEAKDHGFLLMNRDNHPYKINMGAFKASIIDLSDTACVRWIKDIIRQEMIGRGLKGWMADFAEAMPMDVELKNGEPAAAYHNKYPEEWVKLNREAIEEAGYGDSIVFFARSGYSKSPAYSTLFWQGDQIAGWGRNDGLSSAVTGLLSAGLSGFSFNHSDIGGYTSIGAFGMTVMQRSKELLWRWMEMSAFTPVYRTHEGLGPDKNYQVYQDTETAKHFARNAKIYRAWEFYRKQLIQEASLKGIPVCRPLFLHYPNDSNTYRISSQEFMVGSELLVAPVLQPGSSAVKVYLPAGKWVDVWTQKIYNSTGQFFAITGLFHKPAVFYPAGSVIGVTFRNNLQQENIF